MKKNYLSKKKCEKTLYIKDIFRFQLKNGIQKKTIFQDIDNAVEKKIGSITTNTRSPKYTTPSLKIFNTNRWSI